MIQIGKCSCNDPDNPVEPHTCPYLVDVCDDSETLCTCCLFHTEECKDDI